MHEWGDDWPYWNTLYKAQKYFTKFYFKCAGHYPWTKEKYGTIRYEHTFGWITSHREAFIFREAIRRAVKKFPEVAAEVAEGAGHVLDDEYFFGWCSGVAYQANKSYWSSKERPNGV